MTPSFMHDVGAWLLSKVGIIPADSQAATINGPAIDRTGFLSAVIFGMCGAASGTPTTQSVVYKLQESADGSTGWADVSGAVLTDLTADDTSAELDVDLGSLYNYIRVVATVSFTGGTTPAIDVAAVVTLGGKDSNPAA